MGNGSRIDGLTACRWTAVIVVVLSALRAVPADAVAAVGREALGLGGRWQAILDTGDRGERERWFAPTYEAQGWCEVMVPASFANVAPVIDRYEGVGWFRRSFKIPGVWQGRRIVLHFEGVNHTCKVWINGRFVGESEDAFLDFELPLGREVRFDADNLIVVRVDNTRRRDIIPGGRLGWHPFGGILREVELRASDMCRIESIRVAAGPTATEGSLWLQVAVANDYDKRMPGRLEATIFDPEGSACARLTLGSVELEAGQQKVFEVSRQVEAVRAWSPEQPALYRADVQFIGEDRLLDERAARFGFRKIEARGERLFLNDRPMFLTGFNRHEDSPRTDMSPDHELTRRELLQMKGMGSNFIRLCHYPQHPRTIDLCDELGLLVMCEIPLYMWPGLEEGLENYRRTVESAKRQLTKMIDRDYNHPSVIFWSVSNEIHTQHPEVRGTNVVLIQQAKRRDPTRLAVHVSDHWQHDRGLGDSFGEDDVICLNGYPHPKEGPGWWRTRLEELRRAYPGKPIFISEFGGEADRDVEWQIGRLKAGFEGTTASYVCGVTIWCWADHPWDKTWLEPPLSPYGVFTRDRQPRPSVEVATRGFRERQSQFKTQSK